MTTVVRVVVRVDDEAPEVVRVVVSDSVAAARPPDFLRPVVVVCKQCQNSLWAISKGGMLSYTVIHMPTGE